MLIFLVIICLLGVSLVQALPPRTELNSNTINIGLAVDDHSVSDAHLLISSVLQSSLVANRIRFLILACGRDEIVALKLRNSLNQSLNILFPFASTQFHIQGFSLPVNSGFELQLKNTYRAKKVNHWNSPSGADMARFFLPQQFPYAERILYLDNDVIASCCVEDIYYSDMQGKVVGIALDDLKWATVTQFKWHYNASHPLIILNMRRNASASQQTKFKSEFEVSSEEFVRSVPRYPNDGVLLFNTKLYNQLQILQAMDDIARANTISYAVNIGTQQFTVLTMHDRWIELTPRANLRHFPDMARGYLMWFYYNGLLHYAGTHKPKTLCPYGDSSNSLRVQSFTPWLQALYGLHLSDHLLPQRNLASLASIPQNLFHQHAQCIRHMVASNNPIAFLSLLRKWTLSKDGQDEGLVYLRIGHFVPLPFDMTAVQKQGSQVLQATETMPFTNLTVNSDKTSATVPCTMRRPFGKDIDLIQASDILAASVAKWTWVVFDKAQHKENDPLHTQIGPTYNTTIAASLTAASNNAAGGKGKGGKRFHYVREAAKRSLDFYPMYRLCQRSHPLYADATPSQQSAAAAGGGGGGGCLESLDLIRGMKRQHWDLTMVTIASGPDVTNEESLHMLYGLDLVFLRPKFMLVRLTAEQSSVGASSIRDKVENYLQRRGFMTGRASYDEEWPCSSSKDNSKDNNRFVYIWGVRFNHLELK